MDSLKENKVMYVLTYINLVLVAVCIVGCLYGIAVTKNVYFIIEAFVEIIALIASITYFAMGYKKDAAKYYKMFMLFEASTFLIEYLVYSFIPNTIGTSGIVLVFSFILYGNTLLLGVAKDLGKKVTISLASANLLVYTVMLIGCGFVSYNSEIEKLDSILMSLTWFALAGITLLMTIAKYIDKSKRNAK